MKKTPLFLILTFFLGLLLILSGRASAAPVAQATNLLQNPGMEQPFSKGVAQGWQRWFRSTPRTSDDCTTAYHYEPKWVLETNPTFVNSGTASQLVGNTWDTWSGGVYQNVPATPGTTYRFTFYGRGRGSNKQVPEPSETGLQINMQAGIDPNGSGVWSDSDVVWGGVGSPHDTWQPFTVEATATGNQITVFTSANWAVNGVNQCRGHMDTWYDTAELIAVSVAAPTSPPPPPPAPATATPPPPPPTTTPAEPPTATVEPPTATPAATATPVGSSSICVNAFLDTNGSGLHDADEGNVAGITMTVAQGTTIVGQAVSTGMGDPVCFNNLLPGVYQVGQTLPATLEMTTQGNATVTLGEGQTIGLEFGSRVRETEPAGGQPTATSDAVADTAATATPPATGNTAGGTSWLVYLGVGAMVIGAALLGALLYALLHK